MLMLFLSSVRAENAIDLALTKYGQVDTSNPAMELTFNETIDEFTVQLKCGSKRFNKTATMISQGQNGFGDFWNCGYLLGPNTHWSSRRDASIEVSR